MIFLCCDTATPWECVAVVQDGTLLAERAEQRPRGHGPTLLDALDAALVDAGVSLRQVDGFVCGLGPGSFTGLRLSLATLKGLALAVDRPLYGVPTLEALRGAPGDAALPVVAVVDARRGEVFAHGHTLAVPASFTPERLGEAMSRAGRVALVGPGAEMYRDRLAAALPTAEIPAEPDAHRPRPARLVRGLSLEKPSDLATLEPWYVRASDAELNYPDGFPDATVAPKQRLPAKRRQDR